MRIVVSLSSLAKHKLPQKSELRGPYNSHTLSCDGIGKEVRSLTNDQTSCIREIFAVGQAGNGPLPIIEGITHPVPLDSLGLVGNIGSLIFICHLSNCLHALVRVGTEVLRHGLSAVLGPKREAEGTNIALDLSITTLLLRESGLVSSHAHFRIAIAVQRPIVDISRAHNDVLIVKDGQLGMHVDHVPQGLSTLCRDGARRGLRKIRRNLVGALLLRWGEEHEIIRWVLVRQALLMKSTGNPIHHHLHRARLPPQDLLNGRRCRFSLGMERDAYVHLELLVVINGFLDASTQLNGDGVGSLESFMDQPAMTRSQEVLVLDVDVPLGPADVVDVGLLDGIVVPATLSDIDLVVDVAMELDGIGVDRPEQLAVPGGRIVLGTRPVHDKVILLRNAQQQILLRRILLLPAVLKVLEKIQSDRAVVVAMDVVPGFAGSGVAGVGQSDVAVEVVFVLGLERLEEGMVGRIVPAVREIDTSHKPNDAPTFGKGSGIGDGGIDQDALLVMSWGGWWEERQGK